MYFVDYENDVHHRSASSQRLTKKQGDDTTLQTSEQTRNRFHQDVRAEVLADVVSVDRSVENLKSDKFAEEGEKNQNRLFPTGSKEPTTTNAYQKDEIVHSTIVTGKELAGRGNLNSGRSFGPVDAAPELTIQKGSNEEILKVPLKSGLFDNINIRKGPEESSAVAHIPWKTTTQGFTDTKDFTEFVIQKGPPDTIARYKETPAIKDTVVNSLAIQKGPFESQMNAFTGYSTSSDVTGSPTSQQGIHHRRSITQYTTYPRALYLTLSVCLSLCLSLTLSVSVSVCLSLSLSLTHADGENTHTEASRQV